MSAWPAPSLRHLDRLTDEVGVVEHARLDEPRPDLGYCTDDAGRALAIASRLSSDPAAQRVATVALRFLAQAHDRAGVFRLRLGADHTWTDDPPSDDASGRALFGLGVATACAPWRDAREAALDLFDRAAGFRSEHPRALGYAILGAAAVLEAIPGHPAARRLIAEAAGELPQPIEDRRWPWPERRLTYANALLPEAALAAAVSLRRREAAHRALEQLRWLVDEESREGRFSFTPVGGRGPGDVKPAFDQQPIEAWAMADACTRAYACTRDPRWADATRQAASWFVGANDAGMPMFDAGTAGGFDGLEHGGVNRNQGAESTLAFVATMATVSSAERMAARSAHTRREPIRPRAIGPRPLTGRRGDG